MIAKLDSGSSCIPDGLESSSFDNAKALLVCGLITYQQRKAARLVAAGRYRNELALSLVVIFVSPLYTYIFGSKTTTMAAQREE